MPIESGATQSSSPQGQALHRLRPLWHRGSLSSPSSSRLGQSSTPGFTLIELLVVIVILGILGAIAYPAYMSFSSKARYAEAKHKMGVVARELQTLELENQRYPLEVGPNVIPAGVTTWPKDIPFESTFDYDHWADGNGSCHVQLAFWGDSRQREYTSHQETSDPGKFKEVGSNLILTVSTYDCTQASSGPVN